MTSRVTLRGTPHGGDSQPATGAYIAPCGRRYWRGGAWQSGGGKASRPDAGIGYLGEHRHFPVIQLAVTGYDDEQTIQAQLERTVVPELEDVAGVNAAQIVGGVGQRITITPDQAALAGAGYSQQAIRDALDQNGVLFPGGEITEDGQTLTVQTGSKITSVDEIAALPLVPSGPEQFEAGTVTIADVASVAAGSGPGHDDLARRRRAGPHDRGHQAPRREHGRRLAGRARRPARPRGEPRRRRRSRSSSTRRPTSSSRSRRSPRRACSACSSRCSSSSCSCCRCARRSSPRSRSRRAC